MGKAILVLIVVGLTYGVMTIWSSWKSRTTPPAPVAVADTHRENAEGEDSGQPIKVAPAPSSSEDSEADPEKEPLPVVAVARDFIVLEEWGIVRQGDYLEDGSVVQGWDHRHVTVELEGVRERRRVWNQLKVLAERMAATASAVAGSELPGMSSESAP